ncbi:MAG: hypothetical protein M3P49_06530 [Actinomycetota bacterium]|nr:hypothetical protein [Actinomycetota bacterium]
MPNEDRREGMDELSERRLGLIGGERRGPRLAALMARVDAGEAGALAALERRVRGDYEDLVRGGRTWLADEAWAWALERVRDVERSEEHAERVEAEREEAEGVVLPEAPARWLGLRVRVSHLSGGGAQRPNELAGRLEEVTERGIRVAVDELEEERDGDDPASAGGIARRVRSERLICWPALLSVQPLPVRAVGEGI